MIIRMTVLDNDFTDFLESFTKNLQVKIMCDYSARRNVRKTVEIFSKSANGKILTDEDKNFICSQVNKAFSDYVNRVISDDKEKHYLISNFFVEIVDSFQEKWENDEYVYYFSKSCAVVTQ